MFADPAAMTRFQIVVQILQSFDLADRVENEHYVAEVGQTLGEALITIDGFASCRVAAAPDDARQRHFAIRGNVEIGRNWKIRSAFEDNLFDLVCIALDDAGDTCIERRPLRLWAEAFADALLDRADIVFGVLLRLQTG